MINTKSLYLAYIIYPTSVYKPALRFLIFNVAIHLDGTHSQSKKNEKNI